MPSRTSQAQPSQLWASLLWPHDLGGLPQACAPTKGHGQTLRCPASFTDGVRCDLCLPNQILKDKNLARGPCAGAPLPPRGSPSMAGPPLPVLATHTAPPKELGRSCSSGQHTYSHICNSYARLPLPTALWIRGHTGPKGSTAKAPWNIGTCSKSR